ncbi:hypothetical protein Plec18167_000808 [Paecilomyces lecythidis]|uniref:Uncharacterized protein n=1 Tax=Paecilomyces lecythidis TaxID=3004212 RepID=A0ABR3YGD9_9EURO
MGHPVLKLTEQFRYRSVFAAWPNVRTYDGLLKSHPSTQTIVVNSQFTNALKEVLCVENATLDLGNIVVSVEGSLCEVDEASKSRYNDPHRLFILQLLLANVRHGGIEVVTLQSSQHYGHHTLPSPSYEDPAILI